MDKNWNLNLSENDKRQLEILNAKLANQTICIINNFYYIEVIKAAIRETYDKYDNMPHKSSADYMALKASTIYLVTGIIAVILSIEAYKLEKKRRDENENSYPLAANQNIVKATVFSLISDIIFYKCSKEFYYRTMMEENNKDE